MKLLPVGIIYKITNKVNNKVYIGQHTGFSGQENEGAQKRLNEHFRDSRKNRKSRMYLHNAIVKHGEENFTIEVIKICPIDEIDKWEIKYIAEFLSTNKKIGYNLKMGGKQGFLPNNEDSSREKMSEKRRNNETFVQLNIGQIKRNEVHVGYRVARSINGKFFSKRFSSTKYTLEENLQKCKNWLEKIKKQEINLEELITKESKLPKNIMFSKNKKKEITGYKACITFNKKVYAKEFCKLSETMEEKLEKATKFIEDTTNKYQEVK